MTSIGCGLAWASANHCDIDGIAVVSDGGENTSPMFTTELQKYNQKSGKDVPVYMYHTVGDTGNSFAHNMKVAGFTLEMFDLTDAMVDYYSLPNLVKTMRTNRYSLVDEVMEIQLLTLADVFEHGGKDVTVMV